MDTSAPNTTNASSRNRGAHLTATETRDVASALGGLIVGSVCDEGRIHLNPIIQQLSDALGKPCALNHFNSKRRDMIKRLADFYAKDVDQIFKTHNRLGTWSVLHSHLIVQTPQLLTRSVHPTKLQGHPPISSTLRMLLLGRFPNSCKRRLSSLYH